MAREISRTLKRPGQIGPAGEAPVKDALPAQKRLRDPKRIAAFQQGISAESKAAAMLLMKGYHILARRFRSPVGELDIVARRRGTLVFVEVKARASYEEAVEAVTEPQRRRIVAGAEFWLASHPQEGQGDIRFDVVIVTPGRLPQHIPNAFDAGR
jgi:putative endonuclease